MYLALSSSKKRYRKEKTQFLFFGGEVVWLLTVRNTWILGGQSPKKSSGRLFLFLWDKSQFSGHKKKIRVVHLRNHLHQSVNVTIIVSLKLFEEKWISCSLILLPWLNHWLNRVFFAEVPCVGVRSKEINILKMLDHPSIARSSTSHRFFDSWSLLIPKISREVLGKKHGKCPEKKNEGVSNYPRKCKAPAGRWKSNRLAEIGAEPRPKGIEQDKNWRSNQR